MCGHRPDILACLRYRHAGGHTTPSVPLAGVQQKKASASCLSGEQTAVNCHNKRARRMIFVHVLFLVYAYFVSVYATLLTFSACVGNSTPDGLKIKLFEEWLRSVHARTRLNTEILKVKLFECVTQNYFLFFLFFCIY